jgi:uncharacterized protein (TIGR00369 family)
MDGAVQTTVPAGTAFAPVDLKVYFVRPVSPDGQDLVAQGTVIHRGRSIAIDTSQVFDVDGKKVAVATGSALILPGRHGGDHQGPGNPFLMKQPKPKPKP